MLRVKNLNSRFFGAKLRFALLALLPSAIFSDFKEENISVIYPKGLENSIFLKISNFYLNFSISKTASSLFSLIPFPILASLSINFKSSIFSFPLFPTFPPFSFLD